MTQENKVAEIPQGIIDQINKSSDKVYENKKAKGWPDDIAANYSLRYSEGAQFGYSLAQQEIAEFKKNNQGLHDTLQARINVGVKDFEQIQEQDKEIKRLYGLVQMLYKQSPFTDEISWQQFKTENNL